jgi:flagellar assembly protein FliH
MSTGRKFNFNDFCDFEQSGQSRAQADAPLPPAVYSESDMAESRARGFVEGQAAKQAELAQSDAHHDAIMAQRIADGLAALVASETERHQAFRTAAFEVGIAALRKILPDLSRRFGPQELETAIAEILRERPEEPRIVVRVSEAAFDGLAARTDRLAQRAGYEGKLVVLADGGLGQADFKLEWADGGVERIAERTMADVTKAIARLARASEPSDTTGSLPAA